MKQSEPSILRALNSKRTNFLNLVNKKGDEVWNMRKIFLVL
jgi:hypothetical protein